MRGAAEGFEVSLGVPDVANGEADDGQAHVGHVPGGDFLDFGGEGVPVLIQFLDGHGPKNGSQVAFQGLGGDVFDFVHRFA